MNRKLKMKDLVLIALLTAVYMLLYMVSMVVVSVLGPFGHAISPGICGLLSGAVLLFMNRRLGKMWEYTVFTLLVMGAFALMGGGYLPWLVSSVAMAVTADLLASGSRETPVWRLAAASGLLHVGQAWGAIIPSVFFVESYRSHWIERGVSAEEMDGYIRFTRGAMGLLSTAVVFVLAALGMYLGYLILHKHLEKRKA
ncbi:MptD family putative ECF transporter S component [Lachnoclostridium sp. Marseille-P6806]|uniref:MptD family putative ECF transporter S component n=1 Tax=Lachnoclostridium sp. Marseille-P6806 TaxID=2364793 RepID=UPI00102FF34E|nr:MptD family putative ECF transporter S component [Lachnoclostridium sp. Marseille-P6806]